MNISICTPLIDIIGYATNDNDIGVILKYLIGTLKLLN